MKKYLAILALFSLNQLNAQELEVKDLWFFGKKGIISGQLNPAYSVSTSKVTGTTDVDTTNIDVNYKIFYSLTDEFKLGFAPSYSHTKTEGYSAENGFVEPSIVGKYRLLDGAEAPVYLDLAAELSPSLGESEDKNQLRGNSQFALSAAVGQNRGKFSYAFSPKVIYQSTTHNKNAEDDDSTFLFELPVSAQYDISEKFSAVGNASYYLIPDVTSSTQTTESDFVLLAEAGIKYSIIYEMALTLAGNYLHAEGNIKVPSVGNFNYKSSGFGTNLKLDFGF